ncbi:MAG: SWIM zinc finger family protein [Deltaproteobacteria bacterium]|nr:SWIM zinc finger family protein [Deltaproteobacteria bacterium]
MSRRGYSDWYHAPPKRPPPERGIKVKKIGTTWWGQRWMEALEVVLRGDSARLARGRTYARAGRTHDLVIKGGQVTAKVTGSRATPYKVTIKLAQLPDVAWKKAIAGMARKAQFAAELLSGSMPKDIGEVFCERDAGLFPAKRSDLVTSCTCPDWGDPCKHVAATHYVLGEALDRDPFLLFELRGRTKDQVLGELRAARVGDAPAKGHSGPAAKAASASAEAEIPKVRLGKLSAADYDRARGDMPVLHLSFDEPVTHGAVLRQLGVPSAWNAEMSPIDLLAPLIRAAAERARRIALAEPDARDMDDGGQVSAKPHATERSRRGSAAKKVAVKAGTTARATAKAKATAKTEAQARTAGKATTATAASKTKARTKTNTKAKTLVTATRKAKPSTGTAKRRRR